MTKRKAVYAGSFDPLTNGHLWMIRQGVDMFDELVVAIGINPGKTPTFCLEERLRFIQNVVSCYSNVEVASFENEYLVHYAHGIGAQTMLRGIRNVDDFKYESDIRQMNAQIRPEVGTAFLVPPAELMQTSSSFVKGLVGPTGWEEVVQKMVPAGVFAALQRRVSHA